jgi:hypothetical protein
MEAPHSKSHRSTCSSINEFAFHSARASTFSEEEDEGVTAADARSGDSYESVVVRLNVGGTSFATSLGTLTAVPGSYFAALFGSGHWSPSVVPGSQTPFIDRDPERQGMLGSSTCSCLQQSAGRQACCMDIGMDFALALYLCCTNAAAEPANRSFKQQKDIIHARYHALLFVPHACKHSCSV